MSPSWFSHSWFAAQLAVHHDKDGAVTDCTAADDAEVEEEELDGVVDESTEQEFSLKEFILR